MGILDKDGNQVVSYTYDSWGKLLSVTGESAETIGSLNPFRYRGYYYDIETGFYYLNSRYYDPEIGRFVNADALVGANKDLLANNVFAYCSNNPINFSDPSGHGKIWNAIKKTVKQVKTAISNFFGFQNKVTVEIPLKTETYGLKGIVDVKAGAKNAVTATSGKKKTVNFYSNRSNNGNSVGVQVKNVAVSKGISSTGRNSVSASVSDEKVTRTLTLENQSFASFTLEYSEMIVGDVSSGYAVSLNSNLMLYAGIAMGAYAVCAPVFPVVVAVLEKWASSGGQSSPVFN